MKTRFDKIRKFLNELVLGKEDKIELCLCCILARGHLLIEDLPGMGKTLLAHSLAKALGLDFARIQFTSDMLPADITGVSVFEVANSSFRFHQGPIFSSVVLADEINRASPKAQSALLEAMEERQVSIDGNTYTLPDPFFVIATQNPLEHSGTFPLPESQLDRFFMRINLGYPNRASERTLLEKEDRRELLTKLEAVVTKSDLLTWQEEVKSIKTRPALLDYVQDLTEQSRNSANFNNGISPRAALNLVSGARAWAMLAGRDYVIPEDVQDVLPAVIGHRLTLAMDQEGHVNIGKNPADRLLEITPVQ
ncbi:MAG TPA: MoxR family ATPase [Gammaproteobacteria bacterium]|nr:ATPase RavA [bacterium BMS3Abin11]HDH08455.1 MoxR family ATPase [Gammaproteobacteria bacterium]HDH15544.1 MoxR family ATPase [Gammaproteobacteria bacterium]